MIHFLISHSISLYARCRGRGRKEQTETWWEGAWMKRKVSRKRNGEQKLR